MYNMSLIINTHWDREYRWSFAETQFRLAEAVDSLIDIMEKDPDFTYFHTDSQASMMEDYLDIRPERREALKKLIKEGRILTGPWYTLPAEYLVSGESLVRNLTMGHKIAEGLGKVMKVAYNIFSWGQVSQLPQIYKQFGMDTIIFYRGVDQSKLDRLEFKWQAPDGTEVIGITFGAYHRLNFWRLVYLPYILGGDSVSGENYKISRDNLGDAHLTHICDNSIEMVNHCVTGQNCAGDLDSALKGLEDLIATVKDKSSTDELLFLQGFDQENPDPIVSELVAKINEKTKYGKITVSSLETYIKNLRKKLNDSGIIDKLDVLNGEMLEVERVGDAFGPLYNGVFSARMPIKMENNRCEALLTGWSEPVSVWNYALGGEYPTVPLNKAWKELLKNHQHDGIGGCHVDRVTKAMNERYAKVRDVGETVVRNTLVDLTAKIDFSNLKNQEIGVVIYNSLHFARKDTLAFVVDVPADWGFRWSGTNRRDFHIVAKDANGSEIPCRISKLDDDYVFGYLKFGNVMGYKTTRCYVSLEVNVPANGYTTVTLTPRKLKQNSSATMVTAPNCMENEFINVEINDNGTLTVTDLKTGEKFDKINYFEDSSDKGGPLRFDPAYEEGSINTLTARPEIKLIKDNGLETTYRVTYHWDLPKCIEAPLRIHVPHGSEWIENGPLGRSNDTVDEVITTEITLKKGKKQVEFKTVVDNKARDHRLRVVISTNLSNAKQSIADSPFDIVKRNIELPDSSGWYEEAAKTWPTKTFVAVEDNEKSCIVAHDCFTEYEVYDRKDKAVALTMLRCFSTAGNPTETFCYQELAECIGEHTYRYCVKFENGLSTSDMAHFAQEFTVPMHVAQTTNHKGVLPNELSFFTTDNKNFVVTAQKQAEKSNSVIVRGYLESEKEEIVKLNTFFKCKKAYKVNLEEERVEELSVQDNGISFTLRGKEIAGIEFVL